jgi:hypothetical protein
MIKQAERTDLQKETELIYNIRYPGREALRVVARDMRGTRTLSCIVSEPNGAIR